MDRVEAMTKKRATAAGLRFVRRTLDAEISELAVDALEQTGRDVLSLGACQEPDAETVREALWRDLDETVLDLLALAEIVEEATGEEAAHVFQLAVRVGVRTAERLQQADRWQLISRDGNTGLRHASLAYLDPTGCAMVERLYRIIEEGMGTPGLEATFRGWGDRLADVAAELEELAESFGAWEEPVGQQIAAEAAAALRAGGGPRTEELCVFRTLLRACPSLPSPPEEGGTGASC